MLVGLAVTVAPVVALKPVDGDHEYVEAPLAVSDTELPVQILGAVGVTLTIGAALTVTAKHLEALVPQALPDVTHILPAVEPNVTVIDVVP